MADEPSDQRPRRRLFGRRRAEHAAESVGAEASVPVTAAVSEETALPDGTGDHGVITEVDAARAHLIHDLQKDLGVNEAGIDVILDLLDQLYGLRCTLREELTMAPQGSGGRRDG